VRIAVIRLTDGVAARPGSGAAAGSSSIGLDALDLRLSVLQMVSFY
jgi:hypothetical protein